MRCRRTASNGRFIEARLRFRAPGAFARKELPSMVPRTGITILTALLLTSTAHAGAPKKIDFVHDIVPIIKARCAECHTNGKYKGSLSFDSREDLLFYDAVTP